MLFIGLFHHIKNRHKQNKFPWYYDFYLTISLDKYYTGCCTDYGTITVDDVVLPCHNKDTSTMIKQILKQINIIILLRN